MAQDLQHYVREVWAPDVQRLATKRLVAKELCEIVELADGDTYHKPYMSDLTAGTYTKNATSGAVTPTDITTTDEYLSIATARYASFYVDRIDERQMFYNLQGKMKTRAVYTLRNAIDTAVFTEYANAGLDVDSGDFAGSDGVSLIPTTGETSGNSVNILDLIEKIKAKLAGNSVENDNDWFLVVDPTYYYTVVEKYMATHGYKVQDETLVNSFKGRILDMEVYTSQNLATSTVSSQTAVHWLAGKKQAITLGLQEESKLEIKELPQNSDGSIRLGDQYILWNLFGHKTFSDGARELVDVVVRQA